MKAFKTLAGIYILVYVAVLTITFTVPVATETLVEFALSFQVVSIHALGNSEWLQCM